MTLLRSALRFGFALALAVGVWLCAQPRTACAQTSDFRQAQEAYLRGQFGDVVGLLAPLIDGDTIQIRNEIVLQEARKLLGAAYILIGDVEGGRRVFGELLRSVLNDGSPQALRRFSLDPAQYPQAVLDEFGRLHRAMVERLDEEQSQAEREAQEARRRRRAALLALLDLAESSEQEIERDRGPTFVPFGVGQFYNGNDDLGYALLVAESTLFIASLVQGATFLGIWLSLPDDEFRGRQPQTAEQAAALNTLVWSTNLTSAALGALAIIGILEAQTSFVPTITLQERREIPANVLEELELGLGPGGVSLRGRF